VNVDVAAVIQIFGSMDLTGRNWQHDADDMLLAW
jgi:hypothetical protein